MKKTGGNSSILFIQRKSHRAGAQTSLARMLKCGSIRQLQPAVLTGSEGWLSHDLRQLGIPVAVTSFPRLRSFKSQVIGLAPFAWRAARALASAAIRPSMIVANDHSECPPALELSRRYANVPVVGILRTPGMTRRDFEKFECDSCDGLLIVGEELRERVARWTDKPIDLYQEGFHRDELFDMKPWPQSFPDRLLVIGSEKPRKGFSDFLKALDMLEAQYLDFPALECDFTGTTILGDEALLDLPRRARLRFLGRVDDFSALVREYPLAIHPSRAETFGLAPLEAVLAGVPTMASETGAVNEMVFPDEWKFPPYQPAAIAEGILRLWKTWPSDGAAIASLKDLIFKTFDMDQTVKSSLQMFLSLENRRREPESQCRFVRWLSRRSRD